MRLAFLTNLLLRGRALRALDEIVRHNHASRLRPLIRFLICGLLISANGEAWAQPFERSADKQSDGRFTGLAFITDDIVWYEQFQRPEVPEISVRDRFTAGEQGALAIIFSNAEPRNGVVRVTCSITSYDPEGSRLLVDAGLCYEGPFAGPNILHPSLLELKFEVGPEDLPGRSGFQITLRDAHSGRKVNLEVSFMYEGAS